MYLNVLNLSSDIYDWFGTSFDPIQNGYVVVFAFLARHIRKTFNPLSAGCGVYPT